MDEFQASLDSLWESIVEVSTSKFPETRPHPSSYGPSSSSSSTSTTADATTATSSAAACMHKSTVQFSSKDFHLLIGNKILHWVEERHRNYTGQGEKRSREEEGDDYENDESGNEEEGAQRDRYHLRKRPRISPDPFP